MKRVLFFGEAVSLAHAARPYVLATALDPQVYEVHFAVANRFPLLAEGTSLKVRQIHSIEPQAFMAALAAGRPIYGVEALREYVKEDLAVLDEVQPDIVVGDFRLSLSISCPMRGVRYLSITNAHWSPYSCRKRFPFPEHVLGKLLGVELAGHLFNLVQPIVFARHVKPLNRVRREYGLVPFADLREAYTWADMTLYADVPELVPTENLPPNHRYIGPVLWSPDTAKPDWWGRLSRDEVCIYVTLGSSGQVSALGAVLAGLAELPVTVLLATAGRDIKRGLPRNVRVASYLPGSEAAARSQLVVCNGGSATVYQALANGTPVLGIPSNLDQHLTMSFVTAADAGLTLRAEAASGPLVRASVERLLSESRFAAAALRVSECFAAYSAEERFRGVLSEIEQTLPERA